MRAKRRTPKHAAAVQSRHLPEQKRDMWGHEFTRPFRAGSNLPNNRALVSTGIINNVDNIVQGKDHRSELSNRVRFFAPPDDFSAPITHKIRRQPSIPK
ncbi:MAG TPA: hypothetical protein VN643_07470 [Pyrinomonadaceae bacterium]|nr:hypothetical protein [Pyrinomonadaceae bacterium]